MRSALQINIKILRVYLEVTASGLGAISGTSLITIQNAETCNNISGKTLRKLGETTGIEPLFAVAYKRRYLKGQRWHYQYVVDSAAQEIIDLYGVDPANIESALDLAEDYKRRMKFQADVQDYVDMAISSTINLPAFGTEHNNEDMVQDFAQTLAKYAPRLRGFTVYPDGARGGQPLTEVSYKEAHSKKGVVFEENSEAICKDGICEV